MKLTRRDLLSLGAKGLAAASLSQSLLPKAIAQIASPGFWSLAHQRPQYLSTPLGSADINASQSSFTFTSMNFGATHSTRRIFAFFVWRDSATISDPTGAVIGGVTANLVARNGYETTSIAIYEALVPTGASGDVTINFGEAISYGCSVTLMWFSNLSTTPTSSTSKEVSKGNGNAGSTIIPADLVNVPAYGVVVALGALENTSSALSWSSYTEIIERNGANGFKYSIAVTRYTTAQASVAQTFTGAGTTTQTVCHNFIY